MTDAVRNGTPVILFDGVCALCNGAIGFVLRRDSRARFRLAQLQSQAAHRLLCRLGVDEPNLESVLLVVDGRIHRKSRAILEIVRRLDAPWPLLYGLVVVPRILADAVYDFVGALRDRWFGVTTCDLSDEKARARLLHD